MSSKRCICASGAHGLLEVAKREFRGLSESSLFSGVLIAEYVEGHQLGLELRSSISQGISMTQGSSLSMEAKWPCCVCPVSISCRLRDRLRWKQYAVRDRGCVMI